MTRSLRRFPPARPGLARPAIRRCGARTSRGSRAESLSDVTARLLPYWYEAVVPDLRSGACVLIVSHGNTLRALIKHLDAIGDHEIAALEIPNGVPLLCRLDSGMRPLARGGSYLAG
jgi:2,3-bisphosphoglycerate-dependent phosphoglycerate mutase